MSDVSHTQKITLAKKYCPKCYQQFEGSIQECPEDHIPLRGHDNDPLIGKVFAERYEIQSVLGLGGMSIVYKAKHRLMDRIVAIKMLHSNLKEDVIALERFRIEAQAASSLNHQNIVSVYDFGVTSDGEPFFIIEFLEGESLNDLIERKGRIKYERAMGYFQQICDGLDAAHKKKIVHRDLKPANVVVIKQEDGSELLKLVDFGIAKLLLEPGQSRQKLTQTGEVFGSPIYMSPEQCLGRDLDTRSDIYALGCLMYECITGVPPLIGETFLETMNKHVNEKPKSMHELVPSAEVPQQLEQLIFRSMSKEPSERFQSAGEIRDALSALMVTLFGSSSPKAAAVSGPATAVQPPCPKKTNTFLYLTILLAAVVIGTTGFIAAWPGPQNDPGTPLSKLLCQINLNQAVQALAAGDFPGAERSAQSAEALARSFGDNKRRLADVLQLEATLYDKWEGHAEKLEKVNAEITELQLKDLKKEFQYKIEILSDLDHPGASEVAKADAKLKAAAQIPGIMSTASRQHGRHEYKDEELLLTKALAVETKLLGADTISLAQVQTQLADCLLQQRKFPEVRSLLSRACLLWKNNRKDYPVEYVRALNKLGQFDLDQSNFKDGEGELAESLKEARLLHNNKDVLLMCMRSYADLLRQAHRESLSNQLFHEADVLEGRAH